MTNMFMLQLSFIHILLHASLEEPGLNSIQSALKIQEVVLETVAQNHL